MINRVVFLCFFSLLYSLCSLHRFLHFRNLRTCDFKMSLKVENNYGTKVFEGYFLYPTYNMRVYKMCDSWNCACLITVSVHSR